MRPNFQLPGLIRQALVNSVRTAVVALVSLLLARALKLPESYWASISSIVILLSPIQPLTLAWQRFAGTALGAFLGGLIASYLGSHWFFAAITLTIVLLANHGRPPWIVAAHRFVEVSLGIAVALLVTLVWPLEQTAGMNQRQPSINESVSP